MGCGLTPLLAPHWHYSLPPPPFPPTLLSSSSLPGLVGAVSPHKGGGEREVFVMAMVWLSGIKRRVKGSCAEKEDGGKSDAGHMGTEVWRERREFFFSCKVMLTVVTRLPSHAASRHARVCLSGSDR